MPQAGGDAVHSPVQCPAWPRVALRYVICAPLYLPLFVNATVTQPCEGDLWAEGKGVGLQGMGAGLGSWALGSSCSQAWESVSALTDLFPLPCTWV